MLPIVTSLEVIKREANDLISICKKIVDTLDHISSTDSITNTVADFIYSLPTYQFVNEERAMVINIGRKIICEGGNPIDGADQLLDIITGLQQVISWIKIPNCEKANSQ